ncbi:MAG: PilW family protein, partial [Thermodesulfobacteriota bacterium]
MKKNGFTIIELLIATSILTFMIATMTIALQEQQKQFNLTKEIVDIDQTGRAILDLIASDFRNAASRQGKNVSIQFVNGGSNLDDNGGENPLTGCALNNDAANSGTIASPADCITLTTWDITRGMTADAVNSTTELPSIAGIPTIKSRVNGGFSLDLPPDWFDENDNFIDGLGENDTITLGFRSRTALCSMDVNTNCSQDPAQCSECSAIIRGTLQDKQFVADDLANVLLD